MVRKNLRKADKVLVAVPDVVSIAKAYRKDALYLPNPVDTELFNPAPVSEAESIRVLLTDLSLEKGVDRFVRAFADFQKMSSDSTLALLYSGRNRQTILELVKKLGVNYRILPPASRKEMPKLYHSSDVIATDFALGYLHMASLEAMSCHRPVIQFINEAYYLDEAPPVVPAMRHDETVEGLLLLTDPKYRENVARKQEAYLRRHHEPRQIAMQVVQIYEELTRCR